MFFAVTVGVFAFFTHILRNRGGRPIVLGENLCFWAELRVKEAENDGYWQREIHERKSLRFVCKLFRDVKQYKSLQALPCIGGFAKHGGLLLISSVLPFIAVHYNIWHIRA